MSEHQNNETDITHVFDWVKKGKNNFLLGIETFTNFLVRNIFWLIGLMFVGGLLGYVIEKVAAKKHETSLIVHANQNSTEYVYNFVEGFNKKIDDTIYLKKNGFREHEIGKVEMEPIVNFNDLLEKYRNKDIALLETLMENASAEDILESEFFRSDYNFHKIKMELGKAADSTSILKFISLINNNPYFRELNTIAKDHNNRTLLEYENIMKQVDTTIEKYNKSTSTSQVQNVLVSNELENFINDLLINKKVTLVEIEKYKLYGIGVQKSLLLINEPLIVKKNSVLNYIKILLPIIFVLLYFMVAYFKYSLRKIKRKTHHPTH